MKQVLNEPSPLSGLAKITTKLRGTVSRQHNLTTTPFIFLLSLLIQGPEPRLAVAPVRF